MISPRSARISGHNIQQNTQFPREEMQEHLSASGNKVTKRTISDELHRNCLKSHRPKKTARIPKLHRDARLEFAKEHEHKECTFCGKVLCTYETKIELFGHNYGNMC